MFLIACLFLKISLLAQLDNKSITVRLGLSDLSFKYLDGHLDGSKNGKVFYISLLSFSD